MNLEQFAGVNAGYVLELYDRFRQDRERYRWAQARLQGRAGRN